MRAIHSLDSLLRIKDCEILKPLINIADKLRVMLSTEKYKFNYAKFAGEGTEGGGA